MAKSLGFDQFQLTLSTKFGKNYKTYPNDDPLQPSDKYIATGRFTRTNKKFTNKVWIDTTHPIFLKRYNKSDGLSTVSCFDSITQAKDDSKSGILIRNINDLIDNYATITGDDMVELYNSYTNRKDTKKVRRFADRRTGAERLMNLFSKLREEGIIRKSEKPNSKKPKSERIINGDETRGRKSIYKGRKITTDLLVNPRREESHGYNSLNIVIKNKGLTYEEYVSKGGRRQDLAWDIEKGRVRIKR